MSYRRIVEANELEAGEFRRQWNRFVLSYLSNEILDQIETRIDWERIDEQIDDDQPDEPELPVSYLVVDATAVDTFSDKRRAIESATSRGNCRLYRKEQSPVGPVARLFAVIH